MSVLEGLLLYLIHEAAGWATVGGVWVRLTDQQRRALNRWFGTDATRIESTLRAHGWLWPDEEVVF